MATPDSRRLALHRALLAADSATSVLEDTFGGTVHIQRTAPDAPDLDTACAAILNVQDGESIIRRQVTLHCGSLVLSHATLRYVAQRLPPDIARKLASGTRPFGWVVRKLGLRRTTLIGRICAPGEPHALEHRALLADAAGRPIALADERYGWALFNPS